MVLPFFKMIIIIFLLLFSQGEREREGLICKDFLEKSRERIKHNFSKKASYL